jgi:16S rRNA (uracil1498-N3)-methyltransferase
VNLLLLEPAEVERGEARVGGRRARHLLDVLHVQPGTVLRAGIVDGARGHATVLAAAQGSVRLRVDCNEPERGPDGDPDDVLLLAVPRPKVLARILEHAAALGYRHIVLFRSWKVEKSHLGSRVLRPEVQREHLLLGLEQGQRTHLPRVQFFARFRPFVEDRLQDLPLPAHRFCAHPAAATATAELRLSPGAPFALALGPDGGFLPYEVDQLAARGFLPVRLGSAPLRTESALSALHGQLDLLRQQR